MDLKPGDKFGDRYQLFSKLGSGGMGEVWKARDTELDRDVALKVSQAEFTARFKQEARAMAAFSHPNICQIYDVGPNYIVMELIDGVQLSGPLPVDKAVAYAGQILDALDAAHRKKFTHRDLKPANVMVTKSGILKLLDFGLAKQSATGLGPDDVTRAALTVQGQIAGTLQYMAPEQLQGKEVDERSDIFSFGCVLYEMLTGKRAFDGANAASIIAAVMERPAPSVSEVAPAALDRVVRRCLEKDPDDRWQTARDLKYELEWMAQQTGPAAVTGAAPAKKLRLWQGLVALLALIAVGLAGWMFRPRAEPPSRVARFQIPLPEDVPFGRVTVSPDGRKLIFEGAVPRVLWIRDMDALEWKQLPGSEGGANPFWSPDSRFLGFGVGSQLKKIDTSGGPAQTLCTLSMDDAGTGAWNRAGWIVFRATGGALWKISETGGVPTAVTAVDRARGETRHQLPAFMPDGKHFIYQRDGSPEVSGVYAGSLDAKPSEQSRERIQASVIAAYYANGYLFFMRDTTLMAQTFDAGRLQLRGEPAPVVENVAAFGTTGLFSVSASGALVWRSRVSESYQLTWFDRQGKILSTFGQPGADQGIVLAPDGTRGAVRDAATNTAGDLWTLDFVRGVRTRFTFRKVPGSWATWSADGSTIALGTVLPQGKQRKKVSDRFNPRAPRGARPGTGGGGAGGGSVSDLSGRPQQRAEPVLDSRSPAGREVA